MITWKTISATAFLSLACGVGGGVVGSLYLSPPALPRLEGTTPILRSRTLEIVDNCGRKRVRLEPEYLRFYAPDGKISIALQVIDEKSTLHLSDKNWEGGRVTVGFLTGDEGDDGQERWGLEIRERTSFRRVAVISESKRTDGGVVFVTDRNGNSPLLTREGLKTYR